jgi:16S rRNA U516 pseudouridylate synthase RsuA-like enzyme
MARPVGKYGAKDQVLRVRLDAGLLRDVRALAERRGWSVSVLVRHALVRELEAKGPEEEAA